MQSDDLGLVETLRQRAQAVRAGLPLMENAERCDELAAAIERLVAERDEAREALKPFAKRADEWPLNSDNARVSVRLYDLRRARQALKDAP